MSATRVLYLVRHAKSSWSHEGLLDRDRPLNRRGERDAPRMARRLAARDRPPEAIVSSPAVRARTTAEIFAEEFGISGSDFRIDPDLYGAGVVDLLESARGFSDDVYSALLFAHDPGLTELAGALSQYEIAHLPTCGVVTVEFQIGRWQEVEVTSGRVIHFDFPKRDDA